MADSDDSTADPQPFQRKNGSQSDGSDGEDLAKPDLGIDGTNKFSKSNLGPDDVVGTGPAPSSSKHAPQKREEPPSFSFRHFLRYDMNNYQNLGARPKVYCDGRPITSISDLDLHQITEGKQTRLVSENSSALPDFVQDHLVVEQSYLAKDMSSNDIQGNLPDFAPSRSNVHANRMNSDGIQEARGATSNSASILDLPVRPPTGFPLDLPIVEQAATSRTPPTGEFVTLPDFLTDGPVRTQTDVSSNMQSPEREVDRLRAELESSQRQLAYQTSKVERLEMLLKEAQQCTNKHAEQLQKRVEQAEQELVRSNKRASSAESTVYKLRSEVKMLSNEVLRLRHDALYDEAAGGSTSSNMNRFPNMAKDLRAAADNAEISLKNLLQGVNHLRMLAASVETVDQAIPDMLDDDSEHT